MSYITEEQQVEELKSWWKENRRVILISLFLVFAGVFGWRYWLGYQNNHRLQASAEFEKVSRAFQQNASMNIQPLSKFIQQNEDSSYAVFALFEQTKDAIAQNKLMEAEKYLQKVLDINHNQQLTDITLLRLANVQVQIKKYDAAIQTLGKIKLKSYEGVKQRLLGDIYFAKGEIALARKSYQAVLGNPITDQLEKDLVTLRLNSL